MYKHLSSVDLKKYIGVSPDYAIEGFLSYGTYKKYPYDLLKEALFSQNKNALFTKLDDEFLSPILEFTVDDKKYWFTAVYGSALLCEFLHLACCFGSKKNIHIGSCGGLRKGATSRDVIIPEASYATESTAVAYEPDAGNMFKPDLALSNRLLQTVQAQGHTVHQGKTMTYQAMLGETWEDIQNWAQQGYIGVEMEAATTFAISNHFNVPSGSVLMIADNLIEKETVLDHGYEQSRESRRKVSQDMFTAALIELLS